MRSARDQDGQRGVALLIVLMLLVSVAGVAVATTALMTRAVASAGAARDRDEAVWALLGAERAALMLAEADEGVPRAPVPVQTPDGPVVVSLRSVACVNVNALVSGQPGQYATPKDQSGALAGPGAARLGALVTALGGNGPAGLRLMEAAADFIDTDDVPNTGGEEDFGYARRDVPYRTAGTLLADPSELRAVAGWDVATYRALAPYLCALPSTNPLKIDVNGLGPSDAPILAAILEDAPMSVAERLIAQRPQGGYDDIADFTGLPAITQIRPAPAGLAELGVKPELLELVARAERGGRTVTMTSRLYESAKGWRVIRREFGA